MKFLSNIFGIILVLALVASCAKEDIIPMGEDTPTKKNGAFIEGPMGGKGDIFIGDADMNDDGDDENINDTEIRDPDNDFD